MTDYIEDIDGLQDFCVALHHLLSSKEILSFHYTVINKGKTTIQTSKWEDNQGYRTTIIEDWEY